MHSYGAKPPLPKRMIAKIPCNPSNAVIPMPRCIEYMGCHIGALAKKYRLNMIYFAVLMISMEKSPKYLEIFIYSTTN